MIQTLDPRTGGVAQAVTSLSRGLTARGHEVEIVTLDEPEDAWAAGQSFQVYPLGAGLTSYRYSPKLLPWLRAHGKRFECVIVHGLWQYLSFAAWRRFAGSATPYFVYPHGMLDPWFKKTYPRKHWKKWLSWPWADYRVLRDARAVIFTAEEERLAARQSFWLYRCRERVSSLGLEDLACNQAGDREAFLARHPALRSKRLLLFLGRIHPKKGCDLLIDAFARVTDPAGEFALVLAGPDQIGWQKELRARGPEIAPERLVFTGMLEGAEKRGALSAADAFVLPSHQENFALAVVEALAAGVPVLLSNRINIWREIELSGAGFVETDDLAGVARLLERWQLASAGERAAMGVRARACFEENFTLERAVDSLLRVLEEATPDR